MCLQYSDKVELLLLVESPFTYDGHIVKIDAQNPPMIGFCVANSHATARAITANLLRVYATQVGFNITFHVSTIVDKQGRPRRVDITCI
jgi:hypothetical protein